MTIENLKQIAIKYASTKGSRIPLAPDELCNAVVQYMNSFFGVMTNINTIKVAVTEDSGNIVFTITGNTYDGKPIMPIVITVDHNDFVTDQEFEEFKTNILDSIDSLNNKISEINNTIKNINDTLENNTTDITDLKNRVDNTETNIAEINSTLNNKLDKITSPISSAVLYANINGNDRQISYTSSSIPNTILYRDSTGKANIFKGVSGQNVANMENIAEVEAKIPDVSGFATKSELSAKLDISGGTINGNLTVAGDINTSVYKSRGAEVIDLDFSNTRFNVGNTRYGINIFSSNRPTVTIGESISNIALENDIPEYTSVDSVIYDTTNGAIIAYNGANEIHIPLLAGENVTIDASEDNKKIVISAAGGGGAGDVTAAGNNTFTGENTFTNEITFNTMKSEAGGIHFGNFEGVTESGYNYSGLNDYQFIMQKFVGTDDYYETLINADLITYKPAGNDNGYEFHFPNKSGIFALTSDIPDTSSFVTLAGNNTYTGTNTFNSPIFEKQYYGLSNNNDIVQYGYTNITRNQYTYTFPNKSGTFAMTNDVIKEPIYFISFYANEPSEPCHLIGTMMSKNSYGTGQKTNEEFAVMLADNLYVNSNEGLAAYGKLAVKDILCIYSEDGLSIRCLDEENSEVDLPTVMFFVMETEL